VARATKHWGLLGLRKRKMDEKKAKLLGNASFLPPKQNAAAHPDDYLARAAMIASALIKLNQE